MSFPQRRRRPALLIFALAVTGLTMTSHVPGSAQGYWGFELEWEQPGDTPFSYQLCVDDRCFGLAARAVEGERWRAPLPMLPLGEHRLVVQACGNGGCVSGTPEVYVRVVRPNPRTPPVLTSAPR